MCVCLAVSQGALVQRSPFGQLEEVDKSFCFAYQLAHSMNKVLRRKDKDYQVCVIRCDCVWFPSGLKQRCTANTLALFGPTKRAARNSPAPFGRSKPKWNRLGSLNQSTSPVAPNIYCVFWILRDNGDNAGTRTKSIKGAVVPQLGFQQ